MSSAIDKAKLIEAIQNTNDERVLFAINRLLQIEEEIPHWHTDILQERLLAVKNGTAEFSDWEQIKESLLKS